MTSAQKVGVCQLNLLDFYSYGGLDTLGLYTVTGEI